MAKLSGEEVVELMSAGINATQLKLINNIVGPWKRLNGRNFGELEDITSELDKMPQVKKPLPERYSAGISQISTPTQKPAQPIKIKSDLQRKLDSMDAVEINSANWIASDPDMDGKRRYIHPITKELIKYIPKDENSREPAFDWYVRKVPNIIPNGVEDYNPQHDVFSDEYVMKLDWPVTRFARCGGVIGQHNYVFGDKTGERTDIDLLREYNEDFDTSENGGLTGEFFVKRNFTPLSYVKWMDAQPVRDYLRKKEREFGIGEYIK